MGRKPAGRLGYLIDPTDLVRASTCDAGQSLEPLTIALADASATTRVGSAIASELRAGMVVTLEGDLGAGKTTLVRGALRALGVEGAIKSPTFALVEHYPLSSIYFYHIDFYRFAESAEWETSGLADCFRADSVCFVEWPERVAGMLPPADLSLALSFASTDGAGRTLAVRPNSESGERCVSAIAAAFSYPQLPD